MIRPGLNDCDPYFQRYINLIEGDDILKIIAKQSKATQDMLNSFPGSKGDFRYAPGKWTVKQVVGHLMDTERIFACRALCFARGEKKSMPGFDENQYTENGNFNSRSLADIVYEFRLLRESNLLLFKSFPEDILDRRGIADGREFTIRAIMFIIAGHERHHMNILNERYQQ
ncbi:MAG: DinB family protein [Ignavibacteriaceae bacterium]